MKKILFCSMIIVLLAAMASCRKEQDVTPSVPASKESVGTKDSIQLKAASMTESAVSPKFGRPSSTYYYFKVYDISGALPLSVKLYEKATGTTTYMLMARSGNYWTLSVQLSTNGWFDYRYVYSGSKANISSNSYTLCNSRNTFSSSGTSSIGWPFGADGSSWSNRTVYVNGSNQTWRGGQETKNTSYHIGYGWNEGTHTDIDEQYSDDWNRGTGSQDLGASIKSPLDGYVADYGTYNTSLGSSKYVAIIQEASDGKLYRFYVGHLQSYLSSISVGKYVRAGIDQIGNLGSSGASSPHAHTNLRNVTNNARTSVQFYFNAQ